MSSSDHKPKLEEVYGALDVLYGTTGPINKQATENASEYLTRIQKRYNIIK